MWNLTCLVLVLARPAVFSHTGQVHEAFKTFAKEQIRAKLEHLKARLRIQR